jgi:hypothetical protein
MRVPLTVLMFWSGGILAFSGCAAMNSVRRWSGPEYHQEPGAGPRGRIVLRNSAVVPLKVEIDGRTVVFNPRANPALYADTKTHPLALSEHQDRAVNVSTGTRGIRIAAFDQLSSPDQETIMVADGDVFEVAVESGMSGLAPKAKVDKISGRPAAAAAQPAGDDVFTTLEKLKALRDKGVLSEEEFAAKKLELLKKIQ